MFAHISMHYVAWNAKRLYLSISQCSVRVRFVFLIVKVCTRDKVACGGWVVGGSRPTPETHPSCSLRLCLGFVLCRDKTHQASVCKTLQRGTDTLKTYHIPAFNHKSGYFTEMTITPQKTAFFLHYSNGTQWLSLSEEYSLVGTKTY